MRKAYSIRCSRIGAAALMALALSACGTVPTPLSVASYAVDGISYAVSGKALGDHALSVVMDEDCALTRAVQGRYICHDVGDTTGEELYKAVAAVHGEYSPLNTPYPVVAADSVEAVGEYEGVTVPPLGEVDHAAILLRPALATMDNPELVAERR
jgi:hypothetical protein